MKRILLALSVVGASGVACKKEAPSTPRPEVRREEARRIEVPRPSDARPEAKPEARTETRPEVRGEAAAAFTKGPKAKGDGVKTCPVSGEEVGSGGMIPAEIDYKGRKVKFCCKECIPKFQKEPEQYLK